MRELKGVFSPNTPLEWPKIENKRHRFELQGGSATDPHLEWPKIENKQHKNVLQGRAIMARPLEWPKNSQPDEYYLNEEGMYEVLFGSQQQKACRVDMRGSCQLNLLS